MNEKIGRGIEFLPRKSEELREKIRRIVNSTMYQEESTGLKDKIIATLHELKFRNVIDEKV